MHICSHGAAVPWRLPCAAAAEGGPLHVGERQHHLSSSNSGPQSHQYVATEKSSPGICVYISPSSQLHLDLKVMTLGSSHERQGTELCLLLRNLACVQSLTSRALGADLHPAAHFGQGVFIAHPLGAPSLSSYCSLQ